MIRNIFKNRKTIALFLYFSLSISLSSCSHSIEEFEISSLPLYTGNDIIMNQVTIQNDSIDIEITNNTDEDLEVRPIYLEIEYNGEWCIIPYREDAFYTSPPQIILPNASSPVTIFFRKLDFKIKTGRYRVSKEYDDALVTIEFDLEK